MNETFSLAADNKFRRIRSELERYARNSIRIHLGQVNTLDNSPLGTSKLGGSPDLPVGLEWPSYIPRSGSYAWSPSGVVHIPFLGQLNMMELAPYDADQVLPKTGILSFFYIFDEDQLERFSWDANQPKPEIVNGIKVIYHDVPANELERLEYPRTLLVDGIAPSSIYNDGAPDKYKSCPLHFSKELLLPIEDGICPRLIGMTRDELSQWIKITHPRRANQRISQMLGYPDQYAHPPFIPGDLFLPELTPISEHTGAGPDHRLLLQLDGELEDIIDFPTNGRTYLFCMRDRDLSKKNFSRVWLDTD